MKELIAEALRSYLGDSPEQGGAEEVGWRAVFGKAKGEDVAVVDASLADEFEDVDLDAWR